MPPKSPPSTGATTCPTQPDSGAPCTCFMVRSLSRKISQLYDDTLAPSGLKGTQFSLLAQARVRRGQEPLSVSALAQRLNTDRTTMTRNLRTLEQAGLIALVPGKDARSRCVVLTADGDARYRQALGLWKHAQAEVRALVPDLPPGVQVHDDLGAFADWLLSPDTPPAPRADGLSKP